jgi:hypothetical protein
MGKCVKCNMFYHPDWMLEEEIRGDMVKVCVFCKLDKTELTVIDEETQKVKEVVTKDQAVTNYRKYLERLSHKPRIAEILVKAKKD